MLIWCIFYSAVVSTSVAWLLFYYALKRMPAGLAGLWAAGHLFRRISRDTLLRAVAGLELLDSGRVLIGEADVTGKPAGERDIAMVFQNYALYPHMSVRENMAYGLKIAKVPPPEIEARVQKAAKILEIGAFLDRKPRQLSGTKAGALRTVGTAVGPAGIEIRATWA